VGTGLGDYRPAVAESDENALSNLYIEDPLRCCHVLLKGRLGLLDYGHIKSISNEDVEDTSPT
jgi:hypothetical protein